MSIDTTRSRSRAGIVKERDGGAIERIPATVSAAAHWTNVRGLTVGTGELKQLFLRHLSRPIAVQRSHSAVCLAVAARCDALDASYDNELSSWEMIEWE